MTLQITTSEASPPLILVVDDVLENRSIVQRRLQRMGYECLVADSGPAALDMIRVMSPDLVLLDFMMPEMDGPMVLREIRATPGLADLPVIMLTARTDSASISTTLHHGANDYVVKPIDFAVLKARIDACLLQREKALSLSEANSRLDARAAAQAVELGEVRKVLQETFQRDRSPLDEELAKVSSLVGTIAQTCATLRAIETSDAARSAVETIEARCAEAQAILGRPRTGAAAA
ncbi:PleD family two-component system response regulator [Sphingomonas floccifaciens]|uniref:PleD family two-component system response regulator n=1 Tax=Sphingomonas floccifaciens TaxID=1844115 RepID=A0ABW4NH04_9SPHN